MNRRLLLSTITAGAFSVALAPAAGAASWCEDDPLVLIKTPAGDILKVYVTNYALGDHDGALKRVHNRPMAPYITYTVERKGGSAKKAPPRRLEEWQVNLYVTIPGLPIPGDAVEGRFKTKTVASTEKNATGTILDSAQGWSDEPMRLRFTMVA
jgi:hypothetical protein